MRPLTEREIQVARLIADGLTNDEIADKLLISPSTVKQYSRIICQKLDVEKRRQIPRALREQGLL